MKRNIKKLIALLLAMAILWCMAGCDNTEETTPSMQPTETTAPPPPTENLLQQELTDRYISAVDALEKEPVGLEVRYTKRLTVAGQTYRETVMMSIGYWNLGEENFLARAKRNHVFGSTDYSTELSEFYSNGKVYQTFSKEKYYAELTAEAYIARLVPVQMLDPALYTMSANDDRTQITFADPVAGEDWLVPEDATLTQASGTATLNGQGELEKSTYAVTYQYGPAEITLEYEATVSSAGREPVVPADTSGYMLLDDADAVYALEHTYGYLSQATHFSTSSNVLTLSAAAACSLRVYDQIDVYAVGEEYAAKWEKNTSVNDYANDEDETVEMIQKFIDGKYTMSVDGGRETPSDSVTQTIMQDALRATASSYVQPSSYIASVESSHLGSVLLFEYTGTEEMGNDFCGNICTSLFQDPDLLNKYASSYKTNKMQFYVSLDAYTLLPVAVGINYEGVHVIEGQECILSQQVDQVIDLASLSAYDEIFEKPESETEPEKPATPLFYKVTGTNGQQMWLLGTIHVGDNRTAYLPDEIYDALLSSDALAIECNQEAFEEKMEEDEDLQEKVSDAYYYSDGTTIKDHLVTPELYEDAVKLMKATGNYNFNSEYARPSLWASGINAFLLQRGYNLTREQGVEERLMDLVEENGIPIWEVEDTLFQIQMDAKYSEHLQEVLLYSSMAAGAQEYIDETAELYELWCAGDEEAMREKLKYEPWEIKEEDIALEDLADEELERAKKVLADLVNINEQLATVSDEYEKAMSVDRNVGMLKVAKEYLESGDTVFYAVGLAHLLAENGLVNTLREAGYTVELVSYS